MALNPDEASASIARRIVTLTIVVACATAIALAWLGYRAETRAAMAGVDAKLAALVAAADALVTDDLHQRARTSDVTEAEVRRITERLTRVADEARVAYLYTCVRPAEVVFVEVTSLSEEERANGEAPTLMRVYERPPEALIDTLEDGQTRYAEYDDEYGSFRSIFRPIETSSGRVVIAADMRLDELRAIALRNLFWQTVAVLVVLVPVTIVAVVLGRRVAQPVVALATNVREFADDDFANDEQSIAELERLAREHRDETRTLALSILDLRRRLVRHLEDLTQLTAEKERITAKLNVARDIQRGLLPQAPPSAQGFDIAGWSEAADETGGDFYDWIETPRGDIVFVLADVTGHGVGPSLMAAVCRAYARATLVEQAPLEPLLERLNKLVHGDARAGQFVTFFAGVLEPQSRKLTVLSAAHGPILVYRARERAVVETPTHGLPLGVVDELATDPGTHLTLEPGDALMVVSDGFFEWANVHGEQFGVDRLRAEFLAAAAGPAMEAIERLRRAVYRFTEGTVQPDDMTALVVRCLPRSA